MKRWLFGLSICGLSLMPVVAAGAAPATISHCTFEGTSSGLIGTCGPIFGERPSMQLAPANAIASGKWSEAKPVAVWAGQMTDEDHLNSPLELETYPGAWGILRTQFGWFRVTGAVSSANALTFDMNVSAEIAPNALDAEIIRRAAGILATTAAWNRSDDRVCLPTETTWSIYCALAKSAVEVTGGFDHRRPALEIVREIVEDRSAGRNYNHRLRDYNNDPTTQLSDVQSLFTEALARMNDPAWLRAHGFVTDGA